MAKQIVDHIVLKCSFFIVKEDKVDNVNQATLLSSYEEHTFIIFITTARGPLQLLALLKVLLILTPPKDIQSHPAQSNSFIAPIFVKLF